MIEFAAKKPTKPPHIAVCVPIGGRLAPQFFRSYRGLDHGGLTWSWHDMTGFPVDVARNEITRSILDDPQFDDVTHFLWIDDDMAFGPDAFLRLFKHGVPIAGGLCFSRQPPHKPVIARFYDRSWGFDADAYGFLWDYPADTLIDVDATGGAFLLVERQVFEEIRRREGAGSLSWWTPHDGLSEDFAFCQRATAAGFQVRVDTGCKIGHVGEVIIDEAFSRRNRQFEPQRWHPPLDALLDAIRMRPRREAGEGLEAIDAGKPGPPIVSVVIPTFNEKPEYLRGAVMSALAQTVPTEVIVVDDGSTEPAATALLALAAKTGGRLRLLAHPKNLGIAAALNTGIAAMTTPWFAWLSSDDLFEPSKVEAQLSSMLNAEALAGYTGYHLKMNNSNAVGHIRMVLWNSLEEQRITLRERCSINGSTVLIHRSVLDDVGPFDVSLHFAQDWDMWAKIGQRYWWFGMLDKLTTRREFENLSSDPANDMARKAEDAIVQRRYAVP
jgi:teichuronic acid biosynthesis glycosyltransferase TuaG